MGESIWFSTLVTLATEPIPNHAVNMRGQVVKRGDLKMSYVDRRTQPRPSSTHGDHRGLAVEEPKTMMTPAVSFVPGALLQHHIP